ncbi:hypothetical protein T4A_4026 [Trichinella pseudospiralis]|nr:hypothetical protein T4A_4026 [Trichinella pseudospiralis]KRZ35548.1 hypothetical protein T4C_10129 [Trichinella pseudospiralis]
MGLEETAEHDLTGHALCRCASINQHGLCPCLKIILFLTKLILDEMTLPHWMTTLKMLNKH